MKRIVFICVENACRSQMAEGFAKAFDKDRFEVYSAGSKPSGKINPRAVAFMKELGIDISGQKSKGFDDLTVREFDYAVTMGCEEQCPFIPKAKIISWDVADPKNLSDEEFRKIRDIVEKKVTEFLDGIGMF